MAPLGIGSIPQVFIGHGTDRLCPQGCAAWFNTASGYVEHRAGCPLRTFPVLCAWCLKGPRRIHTEVGRTTVANSHGICPTHAHQFGRKGAR